jgi:hypothetical protein
LGSLANRGDVWLAVTVLYLLLQPAWGFFGLWATGWTGRPGAWLAALNREPHLTRLRVGGQIVYALGIPYAALLLGVADARRLGVAALPWWPHLLFGTLVGLGGILLLAWLWGRMSAACYRRGSQHRLLLSEWQAFRTPWGWVDLVFEAFCLQASWAFVRGGAIAVLGLYSGVFAGLALVAVAWLLRPGSAAILADPDVRARGLLTAGLAVVTALVFLYAENLWLCGLVHALGYLSASLAAGRAYAHATL